MTTKVRFDQPTEAPPARQGFAPRQPRAAVALPRLPTGYPWLYAHYPSRWRVEGGELVPDLIQVSLQPGVSGTGREDGTGGGMADGAILDMQRRGAVVFTDPTLGGALDGESYVARVQTRGGYTWIDYAAEPLANSAKLKIDPARRLRLLRALRDLVEPPEPHIIEAAMDRLERDHAAAYRDADRNPIKQREVARLSAELDVWRAALEQGTPAPVIEADEPAPKPKARRTRSKTADAVQADA